MVINTNTVQTSSFISKLRKGSTQINAGKIYITDNNGNATQVREIYLGSTKIYGGTNTTDTTVEAIMEIFTSHPYISTTLNSSTPIQFYTDCYFSDWRDVPVIINNDVYPYANSEDGRSNLDNRVTADSGKILNANLVTFPHNDWNGEARLEIDFLVNHYHETSGQTTPYHIVKTIMVYIVPNGTTITNAILDLTAKNTDYYYLLSTYTGSGFDIRLDEVNNLDQVLFSGGKAYHLDTTRSGVYAYNQNGSGTGDVSRITSNRQLGLFRVLKTNIIGQNVSFERCDLTINGFGPGSTTIQEMT